MTPAPGSNSDDEADQHPPDRIDTSNAGFPAGIGNGKACDSELDVAPDVLGALGLAPRAPKRKSIKHGLDLSHHSCLRLRRWRGNRLSTRPTRTSLPTLEQETRNSVHLQALSDRRCPKWPSPIGRDLARHLPPSGGCVLCEASMRCLRRKTG